MTRAQKLAAKRRWRNKKMKSRKYNVRKNIRRDVLNYCPKCGYKL